MPGIESRRIGSCACSDGSHWRARCQRGGRRPNGPNASCRAEAPRCRLARWSRPWPPPPRSTLPFAWRSRTTWSSRTRRVFARSAWRRRPIHPCLPSSIAIADSPRARALLSHRAPDGTIPPPPVCEVPGSALDPGLARPDRLPAGRSGLLPLKRQVDRWLSSREHLRPSRTVRYADQPRRVRRCASQEGNAIWTALCLGLADDRTAEWVARLIELPVARWRLELRQTARGTRSRPSRRRRSRRAPCMRSACDTAMPSALAAANRAAELLLSRRLLWRRRDGAVIRPDWGRPVDRIQYPDPLLRRPVRTRGHGPDGPAGRSAVRGRPRSARGQAPRGRRLPARGARSEPPAPSSPAGARSRTGDRRGRAAATRS